MKRVSFSSHMFLGNIWTPGKCQSPRTPTKPKRSQHQENARSHGRQLDTRRRNAALLPRRDPNSEGDEDQAAADGRPFRLRNLQASVGNRGTDRRPIGAPGTATRNFGELHGPRACCAGTLAVEKVQPERECRGVQGHGYSVGRQGEHGAA